MAIPLVLLHVPALLAYVLSDNATKDIFPRRQNACVVVEEFAKAARGDKGACLQAAVEKCKGAAKDPLTLTLKTLAAMHDALSKNTPAIARPTTDPEDTCDAAAWAAERSFVRELFGMQLEAGGELRHALALQLEPTGNSLVKCVRDAIGDSTVRRAPLVLVCGFSKSPKKIVEYPYDFDFSGIKYTLCAVATPEKTLYENSSGSWETDAGDPVPTHAIVVNDACVLAYRRHFSP